MPDAVPFGGVRRERSGRYSAYYTDPTTGARVTAPETFETERAADDWLTTIKADVVRGTAARIGDTNGS